MRREATPTESWLYRRNAVPRWRRRAGDCALLFRSGRKFDLVPTRANGQPAFALYVRGPDGVRHGTGLVVLTLSGDKIFAMSRFENSVYPSFGLPRSLPG